MSFNSDILCTNDIYFNRSFICQEFDYWVFTGSLLGNYFFVFIVREVWNLLFCYTAPFLKRFRPLTREIPFGLRCVDSDKQWTVFCQPLCLDFSRTLGSRISCIQIELPSYFGWVHLFHLQIWAMRSSRRHQLKGILSISPVSIP